MNKTQDKGAKEKRNLASLVIGCALVAIGLIVFAATENTFTLIIPVSGDVLAIMGGLRKW